MSTMTRLIQILCLTTLAACGGGGGDGGGSGNPPPPAPTPPPPAPPPPPPVTYLLGGTVTGLQGSGLVLRNAGVDLPVSASGSFSFAAGLTTGTAYDVTVLTQPTLPTQLCTVSAGQGQVQAVDVTSVLVECRVIFELLSTAPTDGAQEVTRSIQPTLTFSASLDPATVIPGLATLSSIGGDETVTVSATDSTLLITPSRSLLPLTDYTLSVGNTLLSTDGATLADPVELTFRTREAAWGTQEALTGTRASEGGLNVNSSRVVADAQGNVTAIWINEIGQAFKRELWTRHRPAGGDWQAAIRLEENLVEDVGDLAMAVDDSGGVIVAWAQTEGALGTDYNWVLAKRFTPAGGWEATQLVAQMTGNLTQLQMDLQAEGDGWLVWYQAAAGSNSIMSARYLAAGGWQPAQRIDTASTVVFRPQIAVSDDGVATAVWEQYIQGAGNDIFAARFDPANGWSTPARVSVNNTGIAISPSLDASPGGNAVVTWQQSVGLLRYTASSYFTAAQGWTAPVQIESGSGNSDQAQVVMDAQGVALAVWRQAISGVIHVHASRRDPVSQAWSTPQPISNIVGSAAAFYPFIAMDRSGNALVAWYEAATVEYQVMGSRYTPENGWGGAEAIGVPDRVVLPFSVRLAFDGAGTGWAVWAQQDSIRIPIILVNRFE